MEHIEQIIDDLHLEDLRNALHPSIFDENEGYDMLIMRLPVVEKRVDAMSMGFVLTPDNSYRYDKSAERFEILDDRFMGPYSETDAVMDRLLKHFLDYQDRVADMEEHLYEDRQGSDFMTKWLDLKRDILRIERVLLRASTTMQEMIARYEQEAHFPINNYTDLHEHMDRTVRAAALQLSKLDYLYSFYNVRTNEKMNRMIYLLTLISAIFLPLNLVVGFFGMNTSGLPFAEGSFGTVKAVLLMVTLMVLTTLVIYKWRYRVEKES